MKQALTDLLKTLFEAVNLSQDETLWWVLLVGLVMATFHLVSMLITRWGDTNASKKSLTFSLLVHSSFAMGVAAFAPADIKPLSPEPPEEKMQISQIIAESEETVELQEQGNTPIWEKLPDRIETELTRVERTPAELKPIEAPERTPDELSLPEVDVPDVSMRPDEPVATPLPMKMAEKGITRESVAPLKVEETTSEARPEVVVPSTSTVRSRIARSGVSEVQVQRQESRGTVDRIRRDFSPDRTLAAIDAPRNPASMLKSGAESETISNRAGPVPVATELEIAGVQASSVSDGAGNSSPGPPRSSRSRTRLPKSRLEGAGESFRPEVSPRSPNPDIASGLAFRDSVRTQSVRPGLKPNVFRPNIDTLRKRVKASLPATYRLRSLAKRKDVARKFGGTEASERAVELSLQWLVLHQSPEGSWDADRYGSGKVKLDENGVDRKNAGIRADSGVTALAILAFLGAGYTHEEGQYAEQIERALKWLIKNQRYDGFLGGDASHYAKMYCHGMATYAMAEAYGMQSDSSIDNSLKAPLVKAIKYILDNQNSEDGGWRYLKGQRSDVSMFGWQLMALKSAEIAGIEIPRDAKLKMVDFLRERSLGKNDGLATYRVTNPPMPPMPSMTAEALFCKQMLGIRRTNPASKEAVEFLLENLPRRPEHNLYYWYYGTLAMYQYGGDAWKNWNESLRDLLVAEQIQTGDDAGSWTPLPPWGPYGGRVYSTALSNLCLEVYYRFLPLYQMGGRYDDGEK